MYELISVDEAIKKGQLTVNTPALIIMFGIWGLLTYLGIATNAPVWLIITGVVLSFVFAWLYWGLAITRWRLWAFENVRNVHELKKRAIKKQLIWKDGSIFEKTEIRTASQKEQWTKLLEKFKQTDVFIEDYTIPPRTIIYYSKGQAIGLAIIGVMLLCGSVYLYNIQYDIWVTGFLALCGAYMIYSGFKKSTNRNPQIILSYEGVETADTPFFSWADIRNEDTKLEHHGKSATAYFIYDCPEGNKEIVLGDFDVGMNRLEKLLIYYRARYNHYQQKKNSL